jgi:hypothetical protein
MEFEKTIINYVLYSKLFSWEFFLNIYLFGSMFGFFLPVVVLKALKDHRSLVGCIKSLVVKAYAEII